jgi:transposase
VHAADTTVAVIEEDGSVLFEHSFPTSAQNLVAVAEAIAEPKRVVLEESTLAAWVYRTVLPHASRVVVGDPVRNAWIGRDERADDLSAARKLAELLRGGFVQPVHHSCQRRQVFKELVLSYHDTVREITRFKNKLKAKLRQHGLHCTGPDIYHPQRRHPHLDRLQASGARLQAELLLETVDQLTDHKRRLRRELARRAKSLQQITHFCQLPGVGLIRAATFLAVVDTPHRFGDKRKLWAYCGLAVVSRSSGATQGPEHLNRRCNRKLKAMAKGAAVTAIGRDDNQFSRQYRRLLDNGTSADSARLTVARAIVATLYAMWRDDQPYCPRD